MWPLYGIFWIITFSLKKCLVSTLLWRVLAFIPIKLQWLSVSVLFFSLSLSFLFFCQSVSVSLLLSSCLPYFFCASVSIISELCVLCLSVCCWDCLSKDLLIFYLPCLEDIFSCLPFALWLWLELLDVHFLFAARLLGRDQFVWSILQSINNIGASCFVSSRNLSEGFVGSESVPEMCTGVRLPDTDLDCRKASTLSQHCLPQLDLWVFSSWPVLLSLCLLNNMVGR